MKLFNPHKPWVTLQHEEQFIPENYSEQGVDTGAKLEENMVAHVDVNRIHAASQGKGVTDRRRVPLVPFPHIGA